MTDSDSTLIKICSKCLQPLPLDRFHKMAKSNDGLRPECKTCRRPDSASYYQANKDRVRVRVRDYTVENKSRIAAYLVQWYLLNRQRHIENQRIYQAVNKEAVSLQRKIYRHVNRKRLSAISKQYAMAHPERIKIYKDKNRAKRKGASGTCSAAQWLAKCEYHGWRCYLCSVSLDRKSLTIEHRIPLTKGGTEWPANLAPACLPCNLSKSNKTEREYRRFLKTIFASKN